MNTICKFGQQCCMINFWKSMLWTALYQFPKAADAWWTKVRHKPGEDTALDTVSHSVTLCDTIWHSAVWNYLLDQVSPVTQINVKSQSSEQWRSEACNRRHRCSGIQFKFYYGHNTIMIPLDTTHSYVTLNLKFFINLKVKYSNINLIQFV